MHTIITFLTMLAWAWLLFAAASNIVVITWYAQADLFQRWEYQYPAGKLLFLPIICILWLVAN